MVLHISGYFSPALFFVMSKKIIFLVLLVGFTKMHAQQTLCEPSLLFQVVAESGVKMRAAPHPTAVVVAGLPVKSELLVCKELDVAATFENINGHWRRVKYKEKYGYIFDGFLKPSTNSPVASFKLGQLLVINKILAQDMSKLDSVLTYLTLVAKTKGYENIIGPPLPDIDSLFTNDVPRKVVTVTEAPEIAEVAVEPQKPAAEPEVAPTPEPAKEVVKTPALEFKFITEAYNYCGDINELDPGKLWYAVYRKGNQFYMTRVDLLIIRSKYRLGSTMEFDLKADREVQPSFLISTSKLMDTAWTVNQEIDFFIDHPKALYPGQMVELYGHDPIPAKENVTLFATGNVMSVGLCPEIIDYKIKVTGEMHDNLLTQDLTPLFQDLGKCGIPEIFWFGDLNGDLYPELIFVSTSDNGLAFTFFASDTQDEKVLYRKADQWFNKNCN